MTKNISIVVLVAISVLLFGCRKNAERKQHEPAPVEEVRHEANICEGKISQTWHEMPALPESRAWGCAVNVGNAVYMIGGVAVSDNLETKEYDPEQFPQPRSVIWRYDLRDGLDGRWYSFRDMPVPVAGAACVAYRHKIYVMGGYTIEQGAKKNTPLLQIYDTKQDLWSFGPEMTEARVWGAAVVVGEVICVAGGVGKNFSNSVECLEDDYAGVTVVEPRWTNIGEFENGRYGLGAIAKESNILLFGGDVWEKDSHTDYDTVQVFGFGTGASKVLYRLEQATSAIIGTQRWNKSYLYIQGNIWDASNPYCGIVKIGTVPAAPDEFDRVYHGFSYPGVAAVLGGVMVIGGGSNGAPTARTMVFCTN